jgi:membrane-bound metal-dependent hydrolase YbcI (DUF457 family)
MNIQQEKSLERVRVILGSLILAAIAFSSLWAVWRSKASSWKLSAVTFVLLAFVTATLVLDIVSLRKSATAQYPVLCSIYCSIQYFLLAFGPLFDVCTAIF